MRSKVAIAALVVMAGAARADHEVCTTWHGTSIYEAKVSVAGTSALAVVRTIDPDVLSAVTLAEPRLTKKLSMLASTFMLASSPATHLLVASNGPRAEIVAQRLSTTGAEVGARITILPDVERDQRINTVFFDDRDFVVIVETGSFTSEELWKVVVTTDGQVRSGPEPLVVADDSRLLSGPVPGTLWVVEHLNDAARGSVLAWVRGEDGVAGPVVNLGRGQITGAATGASGDLLLLHHPDADPKLLASIVTRDGQSTTVATGVTGFWAPTARPDGSYFLVHGADDVIEGVALDAAGAPLSAPTLWTRGRLRGVTANHIVWTQIIETPALRTNQLMMLPVSANGATGTAQSLATHRQEADQEPCPHGCNDVGGGGSGLLVLLLVLMYVSRDVWARRYLRGAS